jgi:serine/threonine protein kinase
MYKSKYPCKKTRKHTNKKRKIKNKTKNQKTIAGAILGKGAKGTVMHLKNNDDTDNETFCKKYTQDKIQSIRVYVFENNQIIPKNVDNIPEYLNMICTLENKAAKEFKSKSEFIKELNEGKDVLSAYTNNPTYVTLENQDYNSNNIIGFDVTFKSTPFNYTYYYIISKLCNPNFTLSLSDDNTSVFKFIKEILESIKIINENNIYHNDVKLPNIVYCPFENRYNLIDWGASKKIEKLQDCMTRGDPVYSSPIKLYIVEYNTPLKTLNIPKRILQYELGKGKKDWNYLSPNIKESSNDQYNNKIVFYESFKQLLDGQHTIFTEILKNSSLDELYNKYKTSFDVYMLGITIYQAKFRFNLNDARLDDIVNAFIDLNNPIDANGALNKLSELSSNIPI